MPEIRHGRKGEPTEFYQIDMKKQELCIIAQKSQPAKFNAQWFTYVAEIDGAGMGGIRPVGVFPNAESAKVAIDIMYHTITQYLTLR